MCIFPTDPESAVYRGADLDINDVLLNVNCNGIVLGGDMNSDFSRDTGFVQHVNTFMRNHRLQSLWDHFHVDHTYRHTDGISTSTIDHFMVSNSVYNECDITGVVHNVDNTSNQCYIYVYEIVHL